MHKRVRPVPKLNQVIYSQVFLKKLVNLDWKKKKKINAKFSKIIQNWFKMMQGKTHVLHLHQVKL